MRLVRLWTCALFAALGGALFTLPVTAQSSEVIRACVSPSTQVRLIGATESCKSNEVLRTWNVQGPIGPRGNQGPQGLKGDVGPTGATGKDGRDGLNGRPGNNGIDGAIGPTGPAGADGAIGPTGPPGANAIGGGVIVGRLIFGCEAAPSPFSSMGARVRIPGTHFEASIEALKKKKGEKKGNSSGDEVTPDDNPGPFAFALYGVPQGSWLLEGGVMRAVGFMEGLDGSVPATTMRFVSLVDRSVPVVNGMVTDVGDLNTEEACTPPPDGTSCAESKTGVDPTVVTCGGVCTDTAFDRNNCGGCGVVCAPKETCSNSACIGPEPAPAPVPACPAPQTTCGTACVDTSTDVNNCGGCGQVCQAGGACVSGLCAAPPPNTDPSALACVGKSPGDSCIVGHVILNGTCSAALVCQ